MFSGCSMVVASQELVSCDLAGEVVILHLKSGMYYGLNAVGSRIWNLIQTPMRVNDIREVLLQEHDVAPEQCERDLILFLDDMAVHELIEVNNGADA